LERGLMDIVNKSGIPARVQRCGSMLTLFFTSEKVVDWDSASRCNTKQFARFFWGMLEQGVYLPCSQFEAWFVSIAHGDPEITKTIEAASKVLPTLGQ